MRINIYRGQVETNNATNNDNGVRNGVENGVIGVESGVNGVEVAGKTEQTQIEKLLQAVEKNPSATQAYYAEQIGCVKKDSFSNVRIFERKRCIDTVWNNEKPQMGN